MLITKEDVCASLLSFQEAWNRGNIEEACEVYALDASYLSGSIFIRGKQEIIEYYRATYPNAFAMGNLQLELVEFRSSRYMVSTLATAISKWALRRSGEQQNGFAMEAYELQDKKIFVIQDATIYLSS